MSCGEQCEWARKRTNIEHSFIENLLSRSIATFDLLVLFCASSCLSSPTSNSTQPKQHRSIVCDHFARAPARTLRTAKLLRTDTANSQEIALHLVVHWECNSYCSAPVVRVHSARHSCAHNAAVTSQVSTSSAGVLASLTTCLITSASRDFRL